MSSLPGPTAADTPGRLPKRRREDTEQPGSDNGVSDVDVVQSTRFWFRDGTVVLQAASTQFRIHWGILSARSDVFNDMFNVPQPADQLTVDGCLVVIVHDAAEDWEILLSVLYGSRCVSNPCCLTCSLKIFSPVIKSNSQFL